MANVTRKTTTALSNLPFGHMIGAPLNACIEAQAQAARTTVNFINDVGINVTINEDTRMEKKEVIYVYFEFIQNGRQVIFSVPLLTIVPIPYIAINTVDISFKATVSGVESDAYEATSGSSSTAERQSSGAKLGWFSYGSTKLKTAYSTKKDSKSTQDSTYSIEATIDVNVHASQDSMPAGMAKILEMLGSAMDLCDPNGELTVSDTVLYIDSEVGAVELSAMYKTPGGLYDPTAIEINGIKPIRKTVDTAFFSLKKEGDYTVLAGNKEIEVEVKATKTGG